MNRIDTYHVVGEPQNRLEVESKLLGSILYPKPSNHPFEMLVVAGGDGTILDSSIRWLATGPSSFKGSYKRRFKEFGLHMRREYEIY